jgi:hypothetical protein
MAQGAPLVHSSDQVGGGQHGYEIVRALIYRGKSRLKIRKVTRNPSHSARLLRCGVCGNATANRGVSTG